MRSALLLLPLGFLLVVVGLWGLATDEQVRWLDCMETGRTWEECR